MRRDLTRKAPPRDSRVEVTPAYDVRSCFNKLIIGSVRYAFDNGERVCVAVDLHNGMPAYGYAAHEYAPFELQNGDPPWSMPTRPRPPRQAPLALDGPDGTRRLDSPVQADPPLLLEPPQ